MVKPDFNTLPEEHRHILRLAQQRHDIEVILLAELVGGRTGAVLYLASVSSAESAQVEHFILKLDRVHEKARMDEIKRHRLAWSQAPVDFACQHMAELTHEVKKGEQIAIFYTIAGQSLHRFRPLASYERQSQLETILSSSNYYLLEWWNATRTIEQAVHPQSLLDRWLGYRLKPEGRLCRFVEDALHVPKDVEGLLVQGEVFPNPLAYARQSDFWDSVRPIDIITGFQHGDLNIGNILVRFNKNGQKLDGYFLIDFALYKNQMPLLYDLCYLEMSYLIRELERTSLAKWVSLVTRLAEQGRPEPQKVPVELAGACAVINAARRAFERWVEASHASLSDDLWGQFWLAAVAAGLNYCNKGLLANRERLAGMIYAAAHLKCFCAQFGTPAPVEVRLLYDSGQSRESVRTQGMTSQELSPTCESVTWPGGTVTFLFTDMVGSTTLWETYPQEMLTALARHDSILEQSVANHDGYIFKRVGDGFCVVFQSAFEALNAAIDGQHALRDKTWGRTGRPRVRMALRSGAAEEIRGDYFGPAVNRVARLLAVAHGGQILFTEDTLKLIDEQGPPDFVWLDLGRHWLKDLKQPECINQVVAPDLPADFPPLPTVGLQTKNLPEQATPFVGRQFELAQIERLLGAHRLITLFGPGGIGKTRLALAVAEALGNHYQQGAYFVPLLSIDSSTAFVPAVANALDLTFLEGRPPEVQLLDYLRPRQMLLVLDNIEHLILEDGSGTTTGTMLALVEAMLSAAPELKILVTSRELLRIPQEQAFQVRGLPRGDELPGLVVSQDDALELFRLRAQPASEQANHEDLRYIRQICRLVEGMPLAIELAAAQLRLLSIAEIAAEIESNLDVLDTGLRGAGARHGSVRVVFENSWRRLSDDEKLVLARLSVFRGGFTHLAAAGVAQASITDLAKLVDKSLIKRGAGERFVLHALIQMFAAEKLAGMSDEMNQIPDRHYCYYSNLLDEAVSQWRDTYDPASLDVIRPEVDNLRTGWNWILGQGNWDDINIYLDNLWQFFKLRGRLPEAMELLNQALQAGRSADPVVDVSYQAYWERRLGQAHLRMSQLQEGDEHFRRTLALLGWPVPGSRAGLLKGIIVEYLRQALHRAWPGYFVGRWEEGKVAAQEAYATYEQLGNRAVVENETLLAFYAGFRSLNLAEAAGLHQLMARAYALTGYMYALIPIQRLANAYLSRALAIADAEASPEVTETVFRVAGFYSISLGTWQAAATDFRRAAKAAAELGRHWELETNWVGLLIVAYQTGEFDRGLEYAQRISVSANRRGDAGFIAAGLYWQAFFKLRQGDNPGRIIRLLEESASAPDEVMNDLDWIIVFSSLAQAYMRQDQDAKALEQVSRATKVIAAIARPTNSLALLGYADVAGVYLSLWEKDVDSEDRNLLRHAAHRVCEDMKVYARLVPSGKSIIWLYQGLYDWLDGRPRKSQATWQEALILADTLGMPYDQARVHYQIGRHLGEGETTKEGWGRREHLNRAAELFARFGAKYDLACVNKDLSE
jgi:predicted ATPase/class 3 adenylate cyclase